MARNVPAAQPTAGELAAEVGNPLWERLCTELEERWQVRPKVEYSGCSMAPGWNVKYRKGSRAVCTLYPAKGVFTCLVVIGPREEERARLRLTGMSPYLRGLYESARPMMGARWLMIEITDGQILSEALDLIALRMEK